MQASGNHGRNSDEPSPTGIGNLVPSTTPQQSTRGFVAPSSMSIKKTPDITDIIGENGKQKEESRKEEGEKEKGEEKQNVRTPNFVPNDEDDTTKQKAESNTGTQNLMSNEQQVIASQYYNDEKKGEGRENAKEISPSKFEGMPEGRGSLYENFSTQWHTMFERIFISVPTIYIPLKETLPKIENNIIKVSVKNEVQKEHFEAKIRDVLEFLRTYFNEQIEDIIVEANEQLETKKIIYDVKDKLQNFKEQNTEFEDFLQILDLKIKD